MRSYLEPEEDSELLDRLLAELATALGGRSDLVDLPELEVPAQPAAVAEQDPLVRKALAAAHSLLARLAESRPTAGTLVATLLAQPTAERWTRVAMDRELRRLDVVDLLLAHAASAPERLGPDCEEMPLMTLHLAERLDPDTHPHGLVAGLLCQGLALRVEDLIRQRRLRAAELAALRCRDLLSQTSDPLIALEVGLTSVFLDWTQGEGRVALKRLALLIELSRALRSPELEAEMALWCRLLLEDRHCPRLARWMEGLADSLCGTARTAALLAAIRAKHDWLHLGEVLRSRRAGRPWRVH